MADGIEGKALWHLPGRVCFVCFVNGLSAAVAMLSVLMERVWPFTCQYQVHSSANVSCWVSLQMVCTLIIRQYRSSKVAKH